jgi:hypothetical protein
MQNCKKCGAPIHPAYETTGRCEDCWADDMERLGIRGNPSRHVHFRNDEPRKSCKTKKPKAA